ncbi:MAG: DNA alkylation repair protein [Candidatus Moranbacteria bacterium]|jgi:3-methyladenine DNA glycosylase AlkD|nr:DNA alkylation repair protein [Candidatus Moranbacteria bacterium]
MILIQKEIRSFRSVERARGSARFFKTGEGEYGEGDAFLGLTVPQSRVIARKYEELSFENIEILLASKYHEERLIGLLILVERFQSGDKKMQKDIFDFYLTHLDRVNNWDLVDVSAYKIVGEYLLSHPESPLRMLDRLIASGVLWERRVAIVASFAFIKKGDSSLTFYLSEKLFDDTEDLMHKATGWMLREVGKRVSRDSLVKFLKKNKEKMPRTMLRYAIEHFSEKERKEWLSLKKKNG